MWCRAAIESVTHDFNSMYTASTLTTSSPYTVGETELVTYTCAGTDAKFWLDPVNPLGSQLISINLPSSNCSVTTTTVENLAEIEVRYLHQTGESPSIELKLSQDGTEWETIEPDTHETLSQSGVITASFDPGTYYVRLTNTSTKNASIYQIQYGIEVCNCLRVVISD